MVPTLKTLEYNTLINFVTGFFPVVGTVSTSGLIRPINTNPTQGVLGVVLTYGYLLGGTADRIIMILKLTLCSIRSGHSCGSP